MSGKLKKTEGFPTTDFPPARSVVVILACKGGWLGGVVVGRSVFLYLTLNFCVTLGDVASFFGGEDRFKKKNRI